MFSMYQPPYLYYFGQFLCQPSEFSNCDYPPGLQMENSIR